MALGPHKCLFHNSCRDKVINDLQDTWQNRLIHKNAISIWKRRSGLLKYNQFRKRLLMWHHSRKNTNDSYSHEGFLRPEIIIHDPETVCAQPSARLEVSEAEVEKGINNNL